MAYRTGLEEKLEAGRYTEFEERFLLPAIQARSKDNYKASTSKQAFPLSYIFTAETSKLGRESGLEPNQLCGDAIESGDYIYDDDSSGVDSEDHDY